MAKKLQKGDALLIVDVQYDFLPGGALAVSEGHKIIPILNSWIKTALGKKIPIIASLDWHPSDHSSFKEQGGPWPAHCVQESPGAKIHHSLQLPTETIFVYKGFLQDTEMYSAFQGETKTGESLPSLLKQANIKRLWIGGLALDYCVLSSALDALKAGFEVHLIMDATKPVASETGKAALKRLQEAGAVFE